MTTTTLASFILDRIAEDEAVARAPGLHPPAFGALSSVSPCDCGDDHDYDDYLAVDPARVLAQCATLRAVVELHERRKRWLTGEPLDPPECGVCVDSVGTNFDAAEWYGQEWPCPTLRALAAIWSDHEGYREEWA